MANGVVREFANMGGKKTGADMTKNMPSGKVAINQPTAKSKKKSK